MSNTRMVCVVRRDLQMTPGLLAAQVTHIAMGFIKQKAELDFVHHAGELKEFKKTYPKHGAMMFLPVEADWIKEPYIAVLAVNTPEELAVILRMAQDEKLPVHEWRDVIPSIVLEGRVLDCLVGIALGPCDSDSLRKVTGTLPLY